MADRILNLPVQINVRENTSPPYMSLRVGEKTIAHFRKMEPIAPGGEPRWWWDDRSWSGDGWTAAGFTPEEAAEFVLRELGFIKHSEDAAG